MIKAFPLFIPLALSLLCLSMPIVSYLIAWAGSFFILYWTISGKVKPLPNDLSWTRQIMRPLIFNQMFFAGSNILTSIFFFLDANGYFFFEYWPSRKMPVEYIGFIAECQRYYLLAHIAMVMGMIRYMKYPMGQKWVIHIRSYSTFFLKTAILFTFLTTLVSFFEGLSQIAIKLRALSIMCTMISFSLSLPERKKGILTINIVLYAINFYYAMLSGWKANSLVLLIIFGALLYPYFKKWTIIGGSLIIPLWFTFVPYYTGFVRQLSWQEGISEKDASEYAYARVKSINKEDLKETNWSFLVGRFSEIGMFLQYADNVPANRDYYGFQILSQAMQSLIPRIFWKEKPNMEELVMERVYENNIVERGADVSAKPAFIADAYLSGGWLVIFIALYIYGALASILSGIAERWFGGYLLGTVFIYNALFQTLWQGQCFEFLFNTLFWSFIVMVALFLGGRFFGFITLARKK